MIFKNRSPIEIEYKKPLLEIKNKDMLCFNSNNKIKQLFNNQVFVYHQNHKESYKKKKPYASN